MKIHILAISGAMTSYLALELKRLGHQVSGSDQEKIYPPFSLNLQEANIPVNKTEINSSIDLFIVGSAYKNIPKCLDEYKQIQQKKLPYISATQYLSQNLIKKNSILVAGSYGKTTITGILAQVFVSLGYNPSFFIGGQLTSNFPSLKITDSDWSIVEADESINGLDTTAKFLYYPTKHVILTSVEWEHKDSYPTKQDNLQAYIDLVKKIPKDGTLVYNPHDRNIAPLLQYCQGKAIGYNTDTFFSSPLIGRHNQENLWAAATLCLSLGIDFTHLIPIFNQISGIKRRLEVIKQTQNNLFIDDFAQSPKRIKAALDAIIQTYPDYHLKVYFEPHASFLQYKHSLKGFSQAFKNVDEVVLGKIKYSHKLDKKERVSFVDYQHEIGNKCVYLPLEEQVVSYLLTSLKPKEILVHFSSGGLLGGQTFTKISDSFNY